jgi:hypothetical protein
MTIEWLRARVPGFAELPRPDYDEITAFFWLWSFFEASHLQTNANIPAIEQLVTAWQDNGHLAPRRFAPSLKYFSDHFFQGNVATRHYPYLRLDKHPVATRELVERVLTGKNTNDRDAVAVLLIIVYRLRNNLVHGPKWEYAIQNQRENFHHANAVLINAMEMDGRWLKLP